MLLSSCSISGNNTSSNTNTSDTKDYSETYQYESEYDKMLSTIDKDKRFPFIDDGISRKTFYEFFKAHRANVYDYNKAYIIGVAVAAGTRPCFIYQTSDGGKNWTQTKMNFSFYYNSCKAFENGKILAMGRYPDVYVTPPTVYIFDADRDTDQINVTNPEDWFSIFNISEDVIYDVEFSSVNHFDYIIHMKITQVDEHDHHKKVGLLYDGDVVLDSDTLYPIKLETVEWEPV